MDNDECNKCGEPGEEMEKEVCDESVSIGYHCSYCQHDWWGYYKIVPTGRRDR